MNALWSHACPPCQHRNGGCASAGEAPCTLFEATLQDHCQATPTPGMGPDFFDISLVDGFNVNVKALVSGGFNVGQVEGAFSCQTPIANPFDYEACPYELRVYADSIPGTTVGSLFVLVVVFGPDTPPSNTPPCRDGSPPHSCRWRGGTGRMWRRPRASRCRSTKSAARRSLAAGACARRLTRGGSVRILPCPAGGCVCLSVCLSPKSPPHRIKSIACIDHHPARLLHRQCCGSQGPGGPGVDAADEGESALERAVQAGPARLRPDVSCVAAAATFPFNVPTNTHTHSHTLYIYPSLCKDVPAWGAYRGSTCRCSRLVLAGLVCLPCLIAPLPSSFRLHRRRFPRAHAQLGLLRRLLPLLPLPAQQRPRRVSVRPSMPDPRVRRPGLAVPRPAEDDRRQGLPAIR